MFIKDLFRRISLSNRRKKIKKMCRNHIIQEDISLICNNCTAGTMYSDLSLQFMSPTINLCFGENSDFFEFCNHLEQYLMEGKLLESAKKETKKGFENAPIGVLSSKGLKDIEIHFLHYKNFDEANKKWIERSKRINYNKIIVLIEAKTPYEHSQINSYLTLKYPLFIFTDLTKFSSNKSVVHMPFYDKYGTNDKHPILKITSLSGKRGYDTFDFVEKIFGYRF